MNRWLADLLGGWGGARAKPLSELLKKYGAYLHLLRANSSLLENISELEAMASSRGLCGRERLRNTVTRLNVQLYAMAKGLQELSGRPRGDLLLAVRKLGGTLEGTLLGIPPALAEGPLVVALSEGCGASEDLLGGKAAHLASLLGRPGVRIPKAFVISIASFREFFRFNRLEDTVRVVFDALDPEEPGRLVEACRDLRDAVLGGSVPPAVERSVREEVGRLWGCGEEPPFAVRSSASGEDSAFSFAGQYRSVLPVPASGLLEAWKVVAASFFNPGASALRLRRGFGALELGMGALIMPMVDASVSGVAYSRDPNGPTGGGVRIEAVSGTCSKLVDGTVAPVVRLEYPEGPASPPGSVGESAEFRQGWDERLWGRVAALAREAESVFRAPADVEWAQDSTGTLWLIQARPAALRPPPAEPVPPPPGRAILAEGGVRASAGVGCGPVLHVMDAEGAAGAPRGFVAVAPEASPDLALLLPRAAALVTERGGAASHLAAVAREFGVPALFAVRAARNVLPEGRTVTVDATAGRIYGGRVEEVIAREAPTTDLPEVPGPVLEVVRALIPHVTPLRLLDPEAPDFRPENFRSVHDAVRFIHEEALSEMASLGEGLGARGGTWGLKVREKMPMDLWVIPLGSGVNTPAHQTHISLAEITSPLAAALFSGLADPEVARTGTGPVDAAGFLSVVAGSLAGVGELGAPCWALVSDRYLHLSSRIGYHFTTVEASSGRKDADSLIRFLFKGGAASGARRELRARFLGEVLVGLGFKVKQKSDLVSATCSGANPAEMETLLKMLGRLLVCAGRLDMLLGDTRQAAWYSSSFLEGNYRVILNGEAPPDGVPG